MTIYAEDSDRIALIKTREEVRWLDERIDMVRDTAKRGLSGDLDPHVALSTIVQQLAGVSRANKPTE